MKINLDEGFFFGEGAFETIKVIKKTPLFLKDHLKRLNSSLVFFGIEKEINENQVKEYIKTVEEENYALKITVSRENTLFTKRQDPYIGIDRNKEYKLLISKVLRNSTSPMVYHKTINYYENILEKRKAMSEGYYEVLFLNEKNKVCEGSVSNIFFVKDEKIYTPNLESGLLKGTMRDYIIKEYKAIEKSISLEELENYNSVFISNALMGIIPVSHINNIEYKKSPIIDNIISDLVNMGF
ncbi:MAG: aminotransferase class IV [Peptoniphilaceae bacterium]